MKEAILNWLSHNRFIVITPILVIVLWSVAVGCTPTVVSPVSNQKATADVLKIEYDTTMAKFDLAVSDLERQYEQQEVIMQAINALASGQITNWGSLVNLLIASGGVGLVFDNRRKDTVIASMKRVKPV